MRLTIFSILQVFVSALISQTQVELPKVFSDHMFDKVGAGLRQQARAASYSVSLHDISLFTDDYKKMLRSAIAGQAIGNITYSSDLKFRVTGTVDMGNFIIENVTYQSQEDVYVTANIYRPKEEGVYPAVITTHGHWANGRRTEIVQTTAQLLALNGFVCLAVDAWGVGERASNPLQHEYHGSNLGASLMNVGNTLLGLQLVDNIRGVDLLSSLPYVDAQNIGATGASGGGNQAMWLAAMDERVKAVVPVVSVGTFESYVMNSNCACELLPNGLTFTEEDGVLGLIAPRALNILTAMNDANPSFTYAQMKRSFENAHKIYGSKDAEDNITYNLYNRGHGYWDEMQMEMLSFFTKHLKSNNGQDLINVSEVQLQSIDRLACYPKGKLDVQILTTEAFCKVKGAELKNQLLTSEKIDALAKKNELKKILSIDGKNKVKSVKRYPTDGAWERIIIETSSGRLIPILHKHPRSGVEYTIVACSKGKAFISVKDLEVLMSEEQGAILVDLWGIGESQSTEAQEIDGVLPAFHTLSRSSLWLGQPVIGRWVDELNIVIALVCENLDGIVVRIQSDKEVAIAALLRNVISDDNIELALNDLPNSYLFDNRQGVDYYNMSAHLPHILEWGDISLALALVQKGISISNLCTMSGREITNEELRKMGDEVTFLQQKMKIKESVIEINKNIITLK